MAFRALLIILGGASLCAGQATDGADASATPRVHGADASATPTVPTPTANPAALAVKSSVGRSQTASGGRTTFTVLVNPEADGAIVEDGDTVYAHLIVWDSKSSKEEPRWPQNGEPGTIKWLAGSSKRPPTMADFDINQRVSLSLNVGTSVMKGLDVGTMGAKGGEIRELLIPAEEAFGSAGVPKNNISAGAELTIHVKVQKLKKDEDKPTKYEEDRRLRVKKSEEEADRRAQKNNEARRLAEETAQKEEAHRLAGEELKEKAKGKKAEEM